ncbi:MAG: winged helix-turn-helix domain-containing protein, partial [Pseudomonadota bacterium]
MTSSARIHVLEDTALPEVFRLGGSRVDLNANVIETAGREHRITPKAAAVMAQLAAGPGRALTRDELLRIVWADAFPTDDVLSHAITELRRALGDDARNSRFIETIPKVGYRLLVTPEPVRIADPDSPARPSRLTGTALGFAAGLLSGVLATALVLRSQPTVDEAPAIDPLAESFPVSAGPGPQLVPAKAPDGGRVAFVSATAIGEPTDIHVKSLVGEVTRNVTQSRGIFEYSPAWSPDGQSLAFLRFEQGACRVIIRPVDGGLERDVGACIGEAITYVDWSPDGRQLALTLADMDAGVSRINLIDLESGGTGALDYTLSREHDVQPKFSPDGQTIAFRRGVNPRSELFVVSASGGRVRALTELGSRIFGFDWLPDSDRIWFCAQRDGAPSLFEVSLASGTLRSVSGRCPIGLSIAAAGDAIAFEDHAGDENLVETAIDGSEPEAVFVSTRAERDANYAPDGSRLVFVSDRSGEDQLWLGDRGAGEALQLTRLAGLVLSAPRFAPDGESIVFVGRGGGQEALYEVNLRSGIVEVISAPGERVRAGAVGPDGA